MCVLSVDSDKASWFCCASACMLALVEHSMCHVLVHNLLSSFLTPEHASDSSDQVPFSISAVLGFHVSSPHFHC